jgi:UDP-N-acetylmuramoyl-L-alanyl-D-glutamate--2,6-diaminopimelate ligase
MRLTELLIGVKFLEVRGAAIEGSDVKKIAYDSRKVIAHTLFVAVRGFQTDGHQFIGTAVDAGANVVVCETMPVEINENCVYLRVADSRVALASLAKRFYENASDKLKLIGVTGTNGKTTTTMLIKSVLESVGMKSGLIGTVSYEIGEEKVDASRTTPEALELHEFFYKMSEAGCAACVMETSSHALTLKRTHGLRYDVAVFTNLTRDHLDFHGTMENYFNAKKILFDELGENAVAVTNQDDPYGERIVSETKAHVMRYAVQEKNSPVQKTSDVLAKVMNYQLFGTSATIEYKTKSGTDAKAAVFKQIGKFNLYNILAAYGACAALGIEQDDILRGIAKCAGVPGRMEQIWSNDQRTAVVDYAHSPDALVNVIRALKEVMTADARLITVFGCGGNRDKGKRPEMGKIADEESSVVILTSDNPRSENPETILDDIEAGMSEPRRMGTEFYRIENREAAIRQGISLLKQKDVLLVAGKGHETYQEIQGVKYEFDDREIIRKIFAEGKKSTA